MKQTLLILAALLLCTNHSGSSSEGNGNETTAMEISDTPTEKHIGFGSDCSMFADDIKINENEDGIYVPTVLLFCAREAVWKFLKDNCKSLEDCKHPREMPQWKDFDNIMRVHAAYRRLMVILSLLDDKHGNTMEYHVGGGTLLGFLRHDDIIPHDHDVDYYMTKETSKFIREHLHELPNDINLVKHNWGDVTLYKIVDMNTCMPNWDNGPIQIDLFDEDALAKWNEKHGSGEESWDWETDAKPISFVEIRGYKWPIPYNVGKEIRQYYDDKALTYVPFTRDHPIKHGTADGPCANYEKKYLLAESYQKDGFFHRQAKTTQ